MARVALLRVRIAEEQNRVSGLQIPDPPIDVLEVEGVECGRRELLTNDEIQQQIVVLRRMHVDRDQNAPADGALLEDRSEVALNPDEHVEGLPGDAVRLGRVDEGDIPASR